MKMHLWERARETKRTRCEPSQAYRPVAGSSQGGSDWRGEHSGCGWHSFQQKEQRDLLGIPAGLGCMSCGCAQRLGKDTPQGCGQSIEKLVFQTQKHSLGDLLPVVSQNLPAFSLCVRLHSTLSANLRTGTADTTFLPEKMVYSVTGLRVGAQEGHCGGQRWPLLRQLNQKEWKEIYIYVGFKWHPVKKWLGQRKIKEEIKTYKETNENDRMTYKNFLGCSKSSDKREIYIITALSQETSNPK